MYKAFEALSKRLDSLDVNMGRKLDLVNAYVKNASQRTTAWKCKVCTLSRVYACASALLFHCSFNVFEETEGSETEAFSKRFDGRISQFFFVPPTCVIRHFSFFFSRLSTDNQDSMFKAIEALSKRLDSLGTNMERKLDLVT